MAKVKVSIRAAEARVRRKLKSEGDLLVKYKQDSRWFAQYGPYAVVNADNIVTAYGCTLEGLASELGVLKAHEEIADA